MLVHVFATMLMSNRGTLTRINREDLLPFASPLERLDATYIADIFAVSDGWLASRFIALRKWARI